MQTAAEIMSVHDELYINAAACISPQPTFNNDVFLSELKTHDKNKIYCVEPNYAPYLDAIAIRRMSRIVKFGTTAGLMAIRESGIDKPDAISTGTGYGLLEMSQRFLQDCVASGEGIVSPTTFIQSTHNTVSSNIAIIIGSNVHNNTFSQKGFSFESTLYDAALMAKEGASNILIGAYEEVGEFNYAATLQAGELKTEPCNNLDAYNYANAGNVLGEGAAFFMLGKQAGTNCYGKLAGFHTFYNPKDNAASTKEINIFLDQQGIAAGDIDVVVAGISGNQTADKNILEITNSIFPTATIAAFKHLCGEYMTASAFAFWVTAQMLKKQIIPPTLLVQDRNRKPQTVLVYNPYKHYHSLMLFKAC